jgi:amino-acid N-acetyltransferase
MTVPDISITIRHARLQDVPQIHALLMQWAEKKLLLPRSLSELYENVRDFFVCEAEMGGTGGLGGIVGCAALHIDTDKIAELKALAVAESMHGKGVGRRLVEACCDEAQKIGLERVFCLTYQVDFFTKLGFSKVDRSRLPDKVWSECIRCHRFLDCDEIAMWRKVND